MEKREKHFLLPMQKVRVKTPYSFFEDFFFEPQVPGQGEHRC
jgi:hypothetical protein